MNTAEQVRTRQRLLSILGGIADVRVLDKLVLAGVVVPDDPRRKDMAKEVFTYTHKAANTGYTWNPDRDLNFWGNVADFILDKLNERS